MNLKLEDFEGPFDLLLHLIKVSKVDIYNVNLSDIIEQYLIFIDSIDKLDIDKSSEYLVLAAELIRLKSNKLVNKNEIENEESSEDYNINSEEDLRNKLIEYEKYKKITDTFKELEEKRLDYYTKLPENLNEYVDDNKVINSEVDINVLINAFLDMQKRLNFSKPVTTKITRKEYSVSDRINSIRNILNEKNKIEFSELFDVFSKDMIVVTLLSILDMSKNKEISIKQEKVFSKIIIEKM